MKSIQSGDFHLLVSKPLKLPSDDYLVVLNIDFEQEYLSEIDSVSYWIESSQHSIHYKDLEGQFVAEVKLKDWSGKKIKAEINLRSDEFLDCSVDLANEERVGVFVVRKNEDPSMEYLTQDELALIKHRLKDLFDNIKADMDLQKEYENTIRDEPDPGLRHKYNKKVSELRNSIENSQREIEELKTKVAGKKLSIELREKMEEVGSELHELNKANTKLDQLLQNQQDIRGDITRFRDAIMSCFEENVQKIISVVLARLEQSDLIMVSAVINGIDTVNVAASDIKENLESVRDALFDVQGKRDGIGDPVLSKAVGETLKVVDDLKLDFKQRLKVTIPIIPLIMKYERMIELKSSVNLKNTWEWLSKKFSS